MDVRKARRVATGFRFVSPSQSPALLYDTVCSTLTITLWIINKVTYALLLSFFLSSCFQFFSVFNSFFLFQSIVIFFSMDIQKAHRVATGFEFVSPSHRFPTFMYDTVCSSNVTYARLLFFPFFLFSVFLSCVCYSLLPLSNYRFPSFYIRKVHFIPTGFRYVSPSHRLPLPPVYIDDHIMTV